ncbi:PKD domain-containing protein [Cellulophaga sp. HaHaR_3_176]|uniref:PKD domain-containing protein n=1 Tax=Cellulophaga sp. HaHaR_3_176 TaxID=1942464 RepID=UPI001C1F3E07|nr:PKD domain-containing protein [Cellulophaga sp. HaHaR_3_176]QWX84230.1 PKD domain-containing protein [Cellulophaga sp. HaHaR_3_176]
MNNKTERATYLDNMVRYFFVAIILVAGLVVGFKISGSIDCEYVKIDISAMEYRVGDLVEFTDVTENAQKWEWTFGDSTDVVEKRKAYHIYEKPGNYEVRLMVNGQCEYFEELVIKEKKFVLDPNKIPYFDLPESIAVGEKLFVEDSSNRAYSWEWRFGDTSEANASSKKADYTYEEPGVKTVSLVVNGDIRHMASKKIVVYPEEENTTARQRRTNRRNRTVNSRTLLDTIPIIPVDWINPDLESNLGPYISEIDFKEKLEKVVLDDVSPAYFEKYFCGEINKNCIVDGDSMKFLELVSYLKKRKKRKITKLKIFREEDSNCIKYIQVSIKRKWLRIGN